jgi:hypothetical protein
MGLIFTHYHYTRDSYLDRSSYVDRVDVETVLRTFASSDSGRQLSIRSKNEF